jgi:hypothetical protein
MDSAVNGIRNEIKIFQDIVGKIGVPEEEPKAIPVN